MCSEKEENKNKQTNIHNTKILTQFQLNIKSYSARTCIQLYRFVVDVLDGNMPSIETIPLKGIDDRNVSIPEK